MRTSYFSKKATIEKERSLKQGDNICLSGDYEEYVFRSPSPAEERPLCKPQAQDGTVESPRHNLWEAVRNQAHGREN